MADKLSATEHKRILDDLIKEKLDPLKPVTNPRLFMLGGQPGAGKGRVRDAIEKSPQGQGALAIDPDELASTIQNTSRSSRKTLRPPLRGCMRTRWPGPRSCVPRR